MKSDKFVKLLEDKCTLQEQVNAKNERIAALESQIASMKAKKHERRVSFSDLDSLANDISADHAPELLDISPKGRWLKRRISIDGKKITAKAKAGRATFKKTKLAPINAENVSLKSIVESRHRGSWGNNLTGKQRSALYDATVYFLKNNKLPIGDTLQQLQMPQALQEKFNDYLDYLVDKDIFARPRGKKSSAEAYDQNLFLDAIKSVNRNAVSIKKISFEETDESDRSTRQRPVSPNLRIKNKRQTIEGSDSVKKIVKKSKNILIAKQKGVKPKESLKGRLRKAKDKKRKTESRSIFSWFSQNSLFSH